MVTIRDIKTICTAPEGINLLVVKVETSEPGLVRPGLRYLRLPAPGRQDGCGRISAPAADRP